MSFPADFTNIVSAIPEMEGETIGDRLLAGSLFIGLALTSLKTHSKFGVANKNGVIVDLIRDTEFLQSRYLKLISLFPASAIED